MLSVYRDILGLLGKSERRRLYGLVTLYMMRGLFEVIGIASIMPFLAVAADPEIVETNQYLLQVYDAFGFETPAAFLQFLGVAVFLLLTCRIGFEALTKYATIRFTLMRTYALSTRLLGSYLAQPYHWFLNRHSADLGKSVLTEVDQAVQGVVMPALNLVSDVIVFGLIIALVIAVDPLVAVLLAALLSLSYGVIYFATRRYLSRIGADRVEANRERYQVAQESTAGIKDVKVLGLEGACVRRYQEPAGRYARHQASSRVLAMLPSYGLQAIMYGGGMILILFLLAARGGDLGAILPLIGVYAMAGQRLMPAFGTIFAAFTSIRFSRPALDNLCRDMRSVAVTMTSPDVGSGAPGLKQRLELVDVTFTYPEAERPVLDAVSLSIEANTTVGVVGSTGAGKTTVVDVILGLLAPQSGELRVDGVAVTPETMAAWRRSVGYVSQQIFLADDTVAANIAFGVPADEIDMAAVEQSARTAELHGFVTSELPQGYKTMVGERGVRLSGGQRQRIGIARALYNDPDLLVMDEATSALDTITERAVMDAVRNLGRTKTIILIAHRLSTVKACDQIFLMERGRIAGTGTFDALLAGHARFREMAG